MKKLYPVIASAFLVMLLSVLLTGTGVWAISNGASKASPASGGDVRSMDDLIEALGGEENVKTVTGNTVRLCKNIVLNASIRIYSGNYRILGSGCTIYRGESLYEEMFSLYYDATQSSSVAPSLILGNSKDVSGEASDADLTVSGNRDAFSEAVIGPVFALIGNVKLEINPGTVIEDNYTASPGAAIFMQTLISDTVSYTPLEPTLTVKGGVIRNNTSLSNGGAIALFDDSNGNGSGMIALSSCTLSQNSTENDGGDGCGGAIYCKGGAMTLTDCEFTSNRADHGGAIYTDCEAQLVSCNFKNNVANKNGGAICAAQSQDTAHTASITLCWAYMTENSSLGNGGAIANLGGKLKFADDSSSSQEANYVEANTSTGHGAAIYNSGSLEIASGAFYRNKSSEGHGALYNSKDGTVSLTGGDIRVNTSLSGSGLYNLGTFSMSGGCFQGNICTVKNAPQIVNFGELSLGGSFVIDGDVIGLMLTESENGERNASPIELTNILTTNIDINVTFSEEHKSSDGTLSYSYVNPSGMSVYSGLDKFKDSAAQRTSFVSQGFGSYSVDSHGMPVFHFPIMPLFAWILCILALAGVTVTSVFLIKRRKKRKPQ